MGPCPEVNADGKGLAGHAGAVLLRKAADQCGLTGLLSGALKERRRSPSIDRGFALVSMAAAIALGAISMSDIGLLVHLAPLLGAAPSGPTVRRVLGLAGTPAVLDRVARAKARAHAWALIAARSAGFPWPVIAGNALTGWTVIDMDATLVTAASDKEGAAPTWKKGYGPTRSPPGPASSAATATPRRRPGHPPRVWHLPARLARHARQRTLSISADWPWAQAFLNCWHRLCALPALT